MGKWDNGTDWLFYDKEARWIWMLLGIIVALMILGWIKA